MAFDFRPLTLTQPPRYQQVSLSHWGVFWQVLVGHREAVIEGRDEHNRKTAEVVLMPVYRYEPLKYTDEMEYAGSPWKKLSALSVAPASIAAQ